MCQHVKQLAAAHGIILHIRWIKRTRDAYAIRKRNGAADEVQTPPIRSYKTTRPPCTRSGTLWDNIKHRAASK
jgi:hypothetical protein